MRPFTRRFFATCGALALAASAASGQEIAGNFDQLRVLVKSADSIGVRDTQGHDVRGRLLDLSPGSIAILSDGVRREFAASDVDTITASRHGNLATGAKWGLGIGAGLGALFVLTNMPYGRCEHCGIFVGVVTAELAGIGAGIGVGVSALTTSQRVIFARSGEHRTTVSLAPVVDRERKGIMLTARW